MVRIEAPALAEAMPLEVTLLPECCADKRVDDCRRTLKDKIDFAGLNPSGSRSDPTPTKSAANAYCDTAASANAAVAEPLSAMIAAPLWMPSGATNVTTPVAEMVAGIATEAVAETPLTAAVS